MTTYIVTAQSGSANSSDCLYPVSFEYGFSSFAISAMRNADLYVSVVEVIPTMPGFRFASFRFTSS